MQLLLLILGLIAVIVPEQFPGQDPLGWAFIIIAVILLLVQILWMVFFTKKARGMRDDFFSNSRFR